MGILSSLFRRSTTPPEGWPEPHRAEGPPSSPPGPLDDYWYTPYGYSQQTASGQYVTPDTALQSTAVYSAVKVLSETIAGLPLHVYRRLGDGGKEIAGSHPVYDLLHSRPNSWMTAFEFKEMMMTHVLLRGNAYAEIKQGPRGLVDQLVPVHPDRVTVKQRIDNLELDYEIKDARTGRTRILDQARVLHIRGMSLDGINGVSIITYHRETIGKDLAIKEYGSRFFGNDARPSIVFSHPGTLKDSARENLRKMIQRNFGGAQRFSPGVLEEGMTVAPISLTNDDSQYLETMEFSVADIARIFRVPGVLIGVNDKTSTYASAEQFFLSFVTHTILPWCVRMEQAYERDLITAVQTYYVKHNVDGLLRGDLKSRYDAYAIGIERGILSPNEAREKEDMNAREGGDIYLTLANMQRSDQPPPAPEPKQPPQQSLLLDKHGKPLTADAFEESVEVPFDLNAYGRSLYTNGHAKKHEEHA